MPAVETTNLGKIYRGGFLKRKPVHALQNASLNVSAGEIFGLLGPNGAGKTTFVKILLSIVQPTGGDAIILGHSLGSVEIRKKSGYLPESHRYPQFLTGYETLVLFGKMHGIRTMAARDRAQSLLRLLGLSDWGSTKIKKYSKGMLQRLGLAQALMNDPEILFLDEPTDGVDPIGRKEIRDLLKQLRSEGRTVFLNSHLLSEVETISDRVAILNKGEIRIVGTIAEMTTTPLEYEIQVDQTPTEKIIAALQQIVTITRIDGKSFYVSVTEKAKLNEVIDLLRSHSMSIDAVVPHKTSLEDYFVNLIRSEDAS